MNSASPAALHDTLRVQDKVRISRPRNNFELAARNGPL